MRFLAALLFPPLALLAVHRPLSALVNLLWCLVLGFVGVMSGGLLLPALLLPMAHAVLVVMQEDSDERHRQLLAALKAPLPPRRNDEWQLVLLMLAAVTLAGIAAAAMKGKGEVIQIRAPWSD